MHQHRRQSGPPRPAAYIAIAAGLLLFGCERTGSGAIPTIHVTDHAGRAVSLSAPAERIVSLVPAQTDILLALGVSDRLVVRTSFDLQQEIAHLPAIGNALTPNVEYLASLTPQLVISWADAQSRSVVSRLEALGIAAYASRVESIADIEDSVRDLAALTARDAAGDSIVTAMHAALIGARNAVAGVTPVRALYLIGTEPPMVAGPGTFIDEAITIAGGVNVFADAGARWPAVSLEDIVARQPDVVIVATGSPGERAAVLDHLRSAAGWRDLDAVRAQRLHWADPSLFNRPGPAVGETAMHLVRMLHPELR